MGQLLRASPDVRGKQSDSAFLTAEASARDKDCAAKIKKSFDGHKLAHVLVFASPAADFGALMADLQAAFSCAVVGCTTAGEIGAEGYVTDTVVAIGLPASHFAARTVLIEDVCNTDLTAQTDRLIQERIALSAANRRMTSGFSFLMVDGLSRCEDALVNTVAPNLAGFPLFGGSAGDGLRFQSSLVSYRGEVYQGAATITFVATSCLTRVF